MSRSALAACNSCSRSQTVPVHITYADGRKEVVDTRCRIDTGNELTYYENDGILHYVIRKML